MTSFDACTSGTSRVLTLASLQRLKMEALIPASAECEVWTMRKFLNAQSIALIEIHRQLLQVYGYTRLDGQHISCRSSAEVFNHHPGLAPSDFHLSLHLNEIPVCSTSAFSEWQRVSQRFQCQAAESCDTGYKGWPHTMTNVSIPRRICWKIAQLLQYLLQ